jgi:iron only hydrogenase large subunit-like protein
MKKGVGNLKFPLKGKYIAMLAPSFVVDFSYPNIISQLKAIGFEKVTELTFGAKMINRNYHKILEKKDGLIIASVCPGVVETIKTKFPQYEKNLIKIDSPMAAMSKICRKNYPKYKIVFFSPCDFKKTEAGKLNSVDYVIDFNELKEILKKFKIKENKKEEKFDSFYNDYTKIYPVSGGLSKTIHLKGILESRETIAIDGINEVINFLKNPDKKIRFLDATFCDGGCIGGPKISSPITLSERKQKVLNYIKIAKKENIPENRKGIINKAKGISFKSEYLN